MNNSIAVALIICGTLLITMPFVHNCFISQAIADIMMDYGRPVSINTRFNRSYYTACLAIGAAMILTAVVGALKFKTGKGTQ